MESRLPSFPDPTLRACCEGMSAPPEPVSETLVPYLPRLTIEWLRDAPEARVREVEGAMSLVEN